MKFWTALYGIMLFATWPNVAFAAQPPSPEDAAALRAILDAPLPDPKQHTRPQLAQIYVQRGKAASVLGESERALQEFQAGIQVVGPKIPASYDLHQELAHTYIDRGDLRRGLKARRSALAVARGVGRQLFQTSHIGLMLSSLGERVEAKEFVGRAEGLLSGAHGVSGWDNFQNIWTARVALARGQFSLIFGYLAESEKAFRLCNSSIRMHLRNASANDPSRYYLAECTRQWITAAMRQGRLREASVFLDEFREVSKSYAESQGRPLFVSRMAPQIALGYMEQGLLAQATEVLDATLAHYSQEIEKERELDESSFVIQSRRIQAAIEILNGNWQTAEATYRRINRRGVEWSYALLKLGRISEAIKMLTAILQRSNKVYDERSLYLWEHRAFHALALGASGSGRRRSRRYRWHCRRFWR